MNPGALLCMKNTLLLLVVLLVVSCHKDKYNRTAIVGSYIGEQTTGNSIVSTTIEISTSDHSENEITINTILGRSAIASMYAPNKFVVPEQIHSHASISGGGGCGNCAGEPFLVKFFGTGEYDPVQKVLNMVIEEYHQFPGQSFEFYYSNYYVLKRQ